MNLEENIIKNMNLDTEVWEIKDVLIIKEENINNLKNKMKCKDYTLDIYLNSINNCYYVNNRYNHKNIIIDKINQLLNDKKIYEKNECFTQKDFDEMKSNESIRLKEKINQKYCVVFILKFISFLFFLSNKVKQKAILVKVGAIQCPLVLLLNSVINMLFFFSSL